MLRRCRLSSSIACQASLSVSSKQLCDQRFVSTAAGSDGNNTVARLSPRWLSDVKERLGRCITFGLSSGQTQEAGNILQTISQDWRALVAGSEGFLTSRERCGLQRYPIAWGEQDPMAHVNNIVYNRWAETGRIAWTRNFAALDAEHAEFWLQLMSPRGQGLILRAITTEYKFPMKFPDCVSVYHRLTTKPDSSDAFLLSCVVLSERHQRIAARTTEDIALYDYDKGRKVNKDSWLVKVLEETWTLQEESRIANQQRVSSLLDRVRQLELASWDREDAVEAFGDAKS